MQGKKEINYMSLLLMFHFSVCIDTTLSLGNLIQNLVFLNPWSSREQTIISIPIYIASV